LVLVIDSGNTYTKIGQFVDGKLINVHQIESLEDIVLTVQQYRPVKIVLGSVNFPFDQFKKKISSIEIHPILSTAEVPFKVRYKTPATLGIDRLAGIAWAWEQSPGKNMLVIDAGTCITYDIINEEGEYLGGGISPGIELRLKSLHTYTTNLPEVRFKEDIQLIGDTTQNSILSGVMNGLIEEINGIISEYKKKYKDLTIFMSGGSAIFFESKIKHSIFAFPNMVLLGLYSLYEFNIRKDKN
jgi:type III pantothenate kinase